MAETVSIIEISTGKSVQNIGQLKDYIKDLKKSIDDVDKSFEENKKDAEALRAAQAALRDAMYSTTTSADDLIKASESLYDENGKLLGSYNAVVKQMAALKSAWRATVDETERENLGKAIDKLNNSLKDMDASVGVFSRNVGNYESHWKGLAKQTDALDKGFKAFSGGLGAVKGGLEGIAASPAIATIGILASVAMKIADSLKENETAMAGVKKGLDALKPVTDFISGLLETVANVLADIITKAAAFVTSNGVFQKIIHGVVGVGNAIMNFVVAPFKGVIAAIKVFQEEGVKGFRNAARAFRDEMKQGVAFRSNYEAGAAMADGLIKGAKSKKKDVQAAAKETADDWKNEILKQMDDAIAQADKIVALRERNRQRLEATMDEALKPVLQQAEAESDAIMDDIDEIFQAEHEARMKDLKDAEAAAKAKVQLLSGVASSTSSILNSIADMYEANGELDAKQAGKVKALRIAASTIDTISGAIAAYVGAVKTVPGPAGVVLGAVQAATVTAAGLANIAKMRATQVPGSASEGSTSVTPDASAFVSAPSVTTGVNTVRNITSASEEERLNRMASKSKVYLVTSELEAMQGDTAVTVQESSF